MGKIINISGSRINDWGISKLARYVKEHLPEFTLVIGCKPGIYDVDAILIGRSNVHPYRVQKLERRYLRRLLRQVDKGRERILESITPVTEQCCCPLKLV